MFKQYALRKYPFAYLLDGSTVKHDRARREMGPFFADIELKLRLVLRRRGRAQYFATPPRRQAGRPAVREPSPTGRDSVHSRCIAAIQLGVEAGLPIRIRPYDGFRTFPVIELLSACHPGARICVRERGMPEHPGIRPDLQLRTCEGKLLVIIEVCDTHPVGPRKAEIYCGLGVPCLELRAVHGLDRQGVLNAETMWGPGSPRKLTQALLDERISIAGSSRRCSAVKRTVRWRQGTRRMAPPPEHPRLKSKTVRFSIRLLRARVIGSVKVRGGPN